LELQKPNNNPTTPQDSLAEAKKFLFEVLRFWPLVAISLLIALGWAYYQNKYTPRIYPVAMTILVKENMGQENSAALLYNNALIQSPTNAYNEPILLKADPLMQKVVEKLDFHVSFFLEGNIRTTEIYPGPPIEIEGAEGANLPYGQYWIQLISPQHFYLLPKGEDMPNFAGKEHLYAFGDPIALGDKRFVINKKQGFSYQTFYNQPFVLQVSNPAGTGSSYGGRLSVSWVEKGAAVLKQALTGQTRMSRIKKENND
jgi:nitrate reductase NapE component